MRMNIIGSCERYFTPVGRIIVGAFFLLAGIDKIMTFSGKVAWVDSLGYPVASLLIIGAIVVEVGAGAALILGYKRMHAALALALFTLVAAIMFHGPGLWADNPTEQLMFMKNLALMGGLLFMAAHVGQSCCSPDHDHSKDNDPVATL
ncbi:MAG: putative oxidoreductase [Candidatus Azotimanducaceae bacterium]|jgi:putative oxidoreductase